MLLRYFLVFVFTVCVAEKVRYDNYSLHKITPESDVQVQFLKEFEASYKDFDFWKSATKPNEHVSVVAPPHLRKVLEHALKKRSIKSQVSMENIQEAFDAELNSRKKRDTTMSGHLFWNGYQRFENINEWFALQAQQHPNVVSIINVGPSGEGRNMTGIRISRGSGRRAFVIEAGMVGADWLSPTVATYIADQLIKGEDAEARQASNDFDWYIFPVSNPDGHAHSQDAVRLWYKSRRVVQGQYGVDLTRNWNSQWGVSGASFTSSHNNFAGLGPFSEPETRHLSRVIEGVGDNMAGILSFRQFGQRLIIPFAHTTEPLYNYQEMLTIGRRAVGALSARFGTQYVVGNSMDVHDGATGGIVDWAKYRFNPPIAATYLLPDDGSSGYIMNVNRIEPICQETFDSVMAILRESRHLNVF